MSNGINKPLNQQYIRLNNILGWLVFLISAYVYWATIEPTASFWDCSEFIAVDYKLQIGHPPGAPFLQLVAHLISLLTFGNVHKVAPYINRVSATCSALAIMFLFWTITYFAKKLIQKNGSLTEGKIYAILGSGLVGALLIHLPILFGSQQWKVRFMLCHHALPPWYFGAFLNGKEPKPILLVG